MPKTPKPGPEFSREREWTVVLEDLRSQFRAFGEGLQGLHEKVDRLEEKVDRLEGDLETVKHKVGHLMEDVTMLKSAVSALAKDVTSIKLTMATKSDVRDINTRLTALEAAH